jgi:hypothetical protein
MTDINNPIGVDKSFADGAVSIKDIYQRLLEKMDPDRQPRYLSQSGIIGVSWASSGGEATALIREQYLAADGMENIISVLDQLEDDRLKELDFIELNACPGGCVGGVLTVANPYVAKARIGRLRKYMPVSLNHLPEGKDLSGMNWKDSLRHKSTLSLSSDMEEAIQMMKSIDNLAALLPDLDCGSCGAPSCRALAEDIVAGHAGLNDCHFILRKQAAQTVAGANSGISRTEKDAGEENANDGQPAV